VLGIVVLDRRSAMNAPFPLNHVEIHVAHACNLKCESCSHYSDQGHKGVVSLEDAERWMAAWSGRLAPGTFSLVGGEPTIHPKLTEFLELARRHWPRSHLRLVTNGFFLAKHPKLPLAMQRDGNASIYLSLHHRDPAYVDAIRPSVKLLIDWNRRYGVPVYRYESVDRWRRMRHGTGASMQPYEDRQPRKSWLHCSAKNWWQLYDGRMWKCSPLAYLGLQHAKYGLSEKWSPYLGYQPLHPDCSDEELQAFFRREEESVCNMCAANPEKLLLTNPLRVKAS